MCECSSCFLFSFPSVCWDSHWESRLLQTDSSVMVLLFMAWWTGLIGGHSGKADSLTGEIWSGFLFWSPQTFISEWVGWNPAADVASRGETTRYGYRLSFQLRHAQTTLAATLASVVMVTSPNTLHAKAACWSNYHFVNFRLFGLNWLSNLSWCIGRRCSVF